jgi:protein-S-isoprenylcysteine O-methyltransferase Ste14
MDSIGIAPIEQIVGAIWIVWFVTWMIAAGWSAHTVKTTRPGERSFELLFTGAGALALMFAASPEEADQLGQPFYSLALIPAALLVALVGCGFAFCWWARIHLGKMWSVDITLKEGHRIIDSGPYGLVRHPIYTGILLSAWATAGVHRNALGFIGAALMTFGIYLKARGEERLLIAELGTPYEMYRRRVPMLFPRASARRSTQG